MDETMQAVYNFFTGGHPEIVDPVAIEKTATIQELRGYFAAGGHDPTNEEIAYMAQQWTDEKRAEMADLCAYLTAQNHAPTATDIVKLAELPDEQRKAALDVFDKEAMAQQGIDPGTQTQPQIDDEAAKTAAMLGAQRGDGYFDAILKEAAQANKGGEAPLDDEDKGKDGKKPAFLFGKKDDKASEDKGKSEEEKCAMPHFDRLAFAAAQQFVEQTGIDKMASGIDRAIVARALEMIQTELAQPQTQG